MDSFYYIYSIDNNKEKLCITCISCIRIENDSYLRIGEVHNYRNYEVVSFTLSKMKLLTRFFVIRNAAQYSARYGKWKKFGRTCINFFVVTGKVFTDVCVSSGSNTFCAEKIALGSMITAKEYKFSKIVATWKNESGEVFVIPPCGNCRQLMRDINEDNPKLSLT